MMHSAPSLPPRPHLQQRQHQGRHDTGGSLVIGTRFQIMSADSSRVLNESSCPPNLTELLAAIPGAHQVDWAQGYTIAPHPTNEWLPSSIPRDLAFARLSLVLAPVTHLANHGGTRVLVGGVTAVHGYPDRTWSWGSLGQGGHCHPLPAAQFYTRVRPMHPADPACLLDYESGEPTQVFPRSTVSLDFHWAPHDPASPSSALVVAGLSHFASPIWRSPDAPSSNLRQLMLLPDIETWQDTDGCHGLSDFSLCTTDTRATCQWTDSMTALIRTSLHLPPVPTTLQLRHASNTAHDWQQWTRATHSFGSNLAQFHPDNAHLIPDTHTHHYADSTPCSCTTKLTVTPNPSSSSKPYLAAELRCPFSLTNTPTHPSLIYHMQTSLRAASQPGLVSAAFLYSDPTEQEIDIVEVTGNQPRKPQINWFAHGAKQPPSGGPAGSGWPRRLVPGWNATSAMHTYGLVWRPGVGIVWVVDGRPVARVVKHTEEQGGGGKHDRKLKKHGILGKIVGSVLHHSSASSLPTLSSSSASFTDVPLPARPPAGFPIPDASTVLMLNTWPSASGHDWAGVLDKRAIHEGRPGVSAEYRDVQVWVENV